MSTPALENKPTGQSTTANGKDPGHRASRRVRGKLRHGLKAGMMPKEARYIEVQLNNFRRILENEVVSSKGDVDIIDAACIQTAIRWERHAMLAQCWLKKDYDKLDGLTKLHFHKEVARASGERDKVIKQLGINKTSLEPWIAEAQK